MQDFIFFEESWNDNQNINQMSSKFFGNSLTPSTSKSKVKNSKGKNVVKQVVKKAGRGK
jgi:hypothetical protein